jgi:hypothetical protein
MDLPLWLRGKLDEDQKANPSRYPAWIVINTVMPKDERLLWADNLKDCIAALVGARDAGQTGVEIPQLRWLFLAPPNASLPTGGVRQREDDLDRSPDYATDFAGCFQLAYNSIDKETELKEPVLMNMANRELNKNNVLPEAQRLAPRKLLAEVVRDLFTFEQQGGG